VVLSPCWIERQNSRLFRRKKSFDSIELVVKLWSASCKTIQSLELRGDGLRRHNDIIWNGFPWSAICKKMQGWFTQSFEYLLSFPASLLFMSLDFDMISYLKGKGHLLAVYDLVIPVSAAAMSPQRGSSRILICTCSNNNRYQIWELMHVSATDKMLKHTELRMNLQWAPNPKNLLDLQTQMRMKLQWAPNPKNLLDLQTQGRVKLQWAPNPKNLLDLLQTDSSSCEWVWVGPVGLCSLARIFDSWMRRVLREKKHPPAQQRRRSIVIQFLHLCCSAPFQAPSLQLWPEDATVE
jgi:hypothetical protein